MNEEQNDEIILKNPEELTWDEFLDMLEIARQTDNAIAREAMKGVIAQLRNDEGYFWEQVSDINAVKLFHYAGYNKKDDLVKLYDNLRSMKRYNEYKERERKRQIEEKEKQKAIRKAKMANSPLGKLGARVKKLLNPDETQQDSPENTTNDSNDGEARDI